MKSILMGLLLVSSISMAADRIEAGTYKAIDVDSGTIDATLVIVDHQTAKFTVTTPDFTMPEPGCDGRYNVASEVLTADMNCPVVVLPQIHVVIDVKNVNPTSVRLPDGALVNVQIDAFGTDPIKFKLRKVK